MTRMAHYLSGPFAVSDFSASGFYLWYQFSYRVLRLDMAYHLGVPVLRADVLFTPSTGE